jgi:hypothetical protein
MQDLLNPGDIGYRIVLFPEHRRQHSYKWVECKIIKVLHDEGRYLINDYTGSIFKVEISRVISQINYFKNILNKPEVVFISTVDSPPFMNKGDKFLLATNNYLLSLTSDVMLKANKRNLKFMQPCSM